MRPQSEPLRVVIADDEPLARRRLRSLLAEHADIGEVVETENGPDTIRVVREQSTDVLFLDVRMPGANGIEVLEAVGPNAVGAVVLVTAFDDHAVAAFEYQALDYVLKPVDEDRFHATIARVRERLVERRAARLAEETLRLMQAYGREEQGSERHLSRIIVRGTQKTTIVEVSEIDRIEANGDYLALHTGREVHLYRGTLGALEQQLDPREFVRIHRSTIVRIGRIRHLEPYFHGDCFVTLRDGTRLRLSRTYRARVQATLGGCLP
jgi:two-component system LytT family response regulator